MVYVVDDHEDSAEYLARLLRRVGYQSRVFASGAAVLAALAEAPPPGLIILDVMMPEMDGVACLHLIRERFAADRLPVILYTADLSGELMRDARVAGAQEIVGKGTIAWPAFRELIGRYAGGRPLPTPAPPV